jgi:hypothetical protein
MRHRGDRQAVVAVGHESLVLAHTLLARETTYHELGADYLDRRDTERTARPCVRLRERLGHRVTLSPAEVAASDRPTSSSQTAHRSACPADRELSRSPSATWASSAARMSTEATPA